jgi:GNAT superfamily N-acetyltransferase
MLGPEFRIDGRPLGKDGVREAADVACRAFDSGPFFEFVYPEERRRARGVRVIHRTVFAHPGPGARIRTVRDARDRIVGLSLWMPTGHNPLPATSQLAQLPGVLRSCGFRPSVLRTGIAYARATEPLHPKVPHWYLSVLMTEPAAQGRGIGTALMDEALSTIDDGASVPILRRTMSPTPLTTRNLVLK